MEQSLVGKVLDEQRGEFRPGRVQLNGSKIATVEWGEFEPEDGAIYRPTSFIAPGFIELQLNGGLGYDFTVKPEAVSEVAAALPRWGVTSFLPTVITSPDATYLHALEVIGEAQSKRSGAEILGVHLEGPFLNPKHKGAHKPEWLQVPSVEKVKVALETGPLRLLTLAPELPEADKVIDFLIQRDVLVSMGHSGATYEQGLVGHAAGARYATHLLNAMPPLHHREPGLVGAVLATPGVTAGLIVDGIHLHPAIVKMVYQSKGAEGINLVTDAMAGMGMPPGRYDLSGETVIVDETSARLSNGTLAGSIATLDQCVRNMQKFSMCSLAEAIQMVTANPARLLNLENKGRIIPGYAADLTILNAETQVELTFVAGKVAFKG